MFWFAGKSREGREVEGLRELREKIAALETRLKTIELEWDDTFQRLRRITGRLAKTQALDAEPEPSRVSHAINRAELLVRRKNAG